jgi:DNA-binding NtrC family response regulator
METMPKEIRSSAMEIMLPYHDPFLRLRRLPRPLTPRLAPKSILLVDPDPGAVRDAENLLRLMARVEVCVNFNHARDRMLSRPPDLLVANIRLREYNALHLVIRACTQTRSIVYAAHHDPVLARDAQDIGAFYERSLRLASALVGYVTATLPPRDRRNTDMPDRRQFPRGGRRSGDL